MARSSGMDDLFGNVPQHNTVPTVPSDTATRPELIGGLIPAPRGGHTPESIRRQMTVILEAARAADAIPWEPELVRRYTALFPYMAEWLKGGEGDRLMDEFKAEMDRLNAPVDQVAPNWRRIWGLAA